MTHRQQRGVRSLRAGRDDGGHDRVPAARAPLPGMVLLTFPRPCPDPPGAEKASAPVPVGSPPGGAGRRSGTVGTGPPGARPALSLARDSGPVGLSRPAPAAARARARRSFHRGHQLAVPPRSTTLPRSRTRTHPSTPARQTMRDEEHARPAAASSTSRRDLVGGRGVEVLAGSSRISTGKSASSARAIASRWRSPPEIRCPAHRRRVASPSGSARTQSSSPALASAREAAHRTRHGAPGAGSRGSWCRRCGRPARRARRPADASSPASASISTPSSVIEPPRRAGSAAAPCERRLAGAARPDERDAPPGGEVEVDAVERPRPLARMAAPQAAHAQRQAGPRRAPGCGGSSTGGARASITSKTRAADARTRSSVCVAAGRGRDQLEGRERDQREHGEQHAVDARRERTAETPTSSEPHIASPAEQRGETLPDPRGAGAGQREARRARRRRAPRARAGPRARR